ncbi:MAG: hypothetical protein AB7M12_06730 [Hyphomonadaceae bacterium]
MKTLRSFAVTMVFAVSFAGAALAQTSALPGAPSITPSGAPMTAPLPSGTPPEKMAPSTTTTTSVTTTTTTRETLACKTKRAEGQACACKSDPAKTGVAKMDAEGAMRCATP